MNKRQSDIFEAALNEFSNKSFDEASINTIISQSKTSKGTFYHYFKDKQDLYLQLMQHAVELKWQFIEKETTASSEIQPTNIFDQFKQQAALGIKFGQQHPQYFELSKQLSREKATGNPIYDVVQQSLSIDQDNEIKQLFLEAYYEGQFGEQFSVDFVMKTTQYLISHFDEIYFHKEHTLDERLEMLNVLVQFMKQGFSR